MSLEKAHIMSMDQLVNFLGDMADENGTIHITGPQFERTDGIKPIQLYPNENESFFDALKSMPHETLIQIGLQLWEEGHYLYPAEWYDFIPDGYMVDSILGNQKPFKHGETDNDMRFGALSFGFKTIANLAATRRG